ncbi:MAG: glycosyltransferase family 4 protein [Bacteroidales bacterium]|nr:glycosyltransferase family 4 protein [Bacteroidales bacterium]
MRVLYIIHEATISGAPMQMLRIIRNLKAQRSDLHQDILLIYGGSALQEEFRKSAENFYILNTYSSSIRTKIKQRISHKRLMEQHYDIIVANTVVALAPGIEMKAHFHAPLVFYLRESEYSFRIYDGFERDLAQCDRIVTVSDLVKSILIQKYQISPETVEVVHNFPSFKLDATSPNTPLPYDTAGRCIIGLSGEVCWRKGCDLLPILAAVYKKKYPGDKVLFVWTGNCAHGIRQQMEYDSDLSTVRDNIHLTGLIKDPLPYYRSFDIFLILSREESFGNVVAEAAMIGKPVVGFDDCVGAVELLKQGNACLSVPYLDIDGMADALHILYSSPQRRQELGQGAKTWIESRLDDNRSTEQFLRVLESVKKRP